MCHFRPRKLSLRFHFVRPCRLCHFVAAITGVANIIEATMLTAASLVNKDFLFNITIPPFGSFQLLYSTPL